MVPGLFPRANHTAQSYFNYYQSLSKIPVAKILKKINNKIHSEELRLVEIRDVVESERDVE